MKKLNKKGFTLAELLIVVAIIAILIAIGIPVFSTAMERSRETVDLANLRAAYAEFQSAQLSGNNIVRGVYKIDFKQTDNKSWLIDTSGLKNLLDPDNNSGSGGATSGYTLDFPETAGSSKDAVQFKVSGKGKPQMTFVGYESAKPNTSGSNVTEEVSMTDCSDPDAPQTVDGVTTYDVDKITKANSSYYLVKKT